MLKYIRNLFSSSKSQPPDTVASSTDSFKEFFEANKSKAIDFSSLSQDEQDRLQKQISEFQQNQPSETTITREQLTYKLKQIADKQDVQHGKMDEDAATTYERIGLDTGMFLCRNWNSHLQFLSESQIAHLKLSKEEAMDIAMRNFWASYSDKIKIHQSQWDNVNMLVCGDRLEANFFVMGHLALSLKEQIESDSIEIVMPFCDTLLFSPKFTDDVLRDIKSTFEETYQKERSSRVSAYVYRLVEPARWDPFAKIF